MRGEEDRGEREYGRVECGSLSERLVRMPDDGLQELTHGDRIGSRHDEQRRETVD